jgi:chromosome partitioning protein
MQTISTASFKGGTGKSAISLHLASAFTLFHGLRCLLVDLDSQANLTSSLGFSTEDSRTVVPVLQHSATLKEVIQPTCIPGLDIVAANTHLEGVEMTQPLFNDPLSHERLRFALKEVSSNYDLCLLDIPPSINWLCRTAFYAAEYALICAIPEPFSLLAMKRLAKYHESVNGHHKIDLLGIVLSMWDDRSSFNPVILSGVEDAFPGKLLETKVRRDRSVPRAVVYGKPVFLTEKNSRAGADYKKLSQEILAIVRR